MASSTVTLRRRASDSRGDIANKSARVTPLFVSLLEDCGCSLSDSEDTAAVLGTEKAVFQRQLSKSLTIQGPKAFLDSMTTWFEDAAKFKSALLPVTVADENRGFAGQNQDSVVRMLLGIDEIQPLLIKVLLEKLPEFDNENEHIFSQPIKSKISKQIVHQLRWLDKIVSGKELAAKLIEMLTVTSDDTQLDIIGSLPEIVEDADHNYVALELSKKLLQTSTLVLGILECLSNLNISADVLPQIQTTVMQKLASVDIEDMPVIVKFVLQLVTAANAAQVIGELRDKLDKCMSSRLLPRFSSTPLQQQHGRILGRERQSVQPPQVDQSIADGELLVFKCIRSALQFQPIVADSWMKILTAVTEVRVIDLLLLLLLFPLPSKKKQVVSLLQKKLKAAQFPAATLQGGFLSHPLAMLENFAAYVEIAGILMRYTESTSWHFGKMMYKAGFLNSDVYCQQEIVGHLVTHIGSGNGNEIEASLDVLSALVDEDCAKLAKFTCFLKGILDYLDSLSFENIKCIYHIMCSLTYKESSDTAGTQDELYMLVRKQLANGEIKYKRMGVAGALAIVRSLACSSSSSPSQALTGTRCEQVITWLQQMKQCIRHVPEALALLMDELASLLQRSKLNEKLLIHISEHYTDEFQENFVVDVASLPAVSGTCINAELAHGLDSGKECAIAINVLALLLDERRHGQTQSGERCASARTLTSHFRLVRLCEEGMQSGSLEGIDALLGCPLYLFNTGTMASAFSALSKQDQELVCSATLLAINWFREVASAFASQDNTEMKQKVLSRLETIIQLTSQLEKWLSLMPGYCPPAASYCSMEVLPILPANPTGRRKTAGGASNRKKPTNKKKKGAAATESGGGEQRDDDDEVEASGGEEDSQPSDPVNDEETASALPTGSAGGSSAVRLAARPEFLRECDVRLLVLLKCPLAESLSTATSKGGAKNSTHFLSPAQLLFILTDLKAKLEATADCSKRKFGQSQKTANASSLRLDSDLQKSLVAQLLDHASDVRRHFEAVVKLAQANVVDTSTDESEYGLLQNHETIRSCLITFFRIFRLLAAWRDTGGDEIRGTQQEPAVQKKLLLQLAQCHKEGYTISTPIKDVISCAYEFILGLSDHISDIEVATEQVRLLCALAGESASPQLRQKTSESCHGYLQKQWQSSSNAQVTRLSLQFILRTYLSYSDDVVLAMETIVNTGVAAILEAEDREEGRKKKKAATADATDETLPASKYPCLSRQTFSLFYRVMLAEFVVHVKSISVPSTNPRDDVTLKDQEETLVKWNLAVRMFYVFVTCTKGFPAKANLVSILKYGRQVLEGFLKQGMPLLDAMFRSSKDDILNLLKNIQLSTRSLQHVCNHSKIAKDVILIKQVPPMKKCLETFVYRVKALLAVNNCVQAFWLGNLKNRQLDGQEIMSQASNSTVNETSLADECSGTAGTADETEDIAAAQSESVVPESPECISGSESEGDDRN